MLTCEDLKRFFSKEHSFVQNGKTIYLIPLKEFMKTEEFARLSPVSRQDKNDITGETSITKCQFLNSVCFTDVHPHLIVKKTKSEKTVWYVNLDETPVKGTWPNVEYELMVRVNSDGTLNRDFVYEIQKARKKVLGKFINMVFYKKGCERFIPTEYPRYYEDPCF